MLLNEISEQLTNTMSTYHQLNSIYTQHPNAYVSFTSINKLGINPSTPYNTPTGIYAYPIKYVIKLKLQVPFAKDQSYIQVFNVSPTAAILYATDTKADYLNIKSAMEQVLGISVSEKSFIDVTTKTAWRAMYSKLKEHDSRRVSTQILRKAGYDGVVDFGHGMIHKNEPTQAVFFHRSKLIQLTTIMNKGAAKKTINTITQKPLDFDKWLQYLIKAISSKRDTRVELRIPSNLQDHIFDNTYPDKLSQQLNIPIKVVDHMRTYTLTHGRIKSFEPYIIQDPQSAANYALVALNKRWPEAESTIIKDPRAAVIYSTQVLKSRWPEAEQIIGSHKDAVKAYNAVFHTDI